jgi:hypothetical protein
MEVGRKNDTQTNKTKTQNKTDKHTFLVTLLSLLTITPFVSSWECLSIKRSMFPVIGYLLGLFGNLFFTVSKTFTQPLS